MKVIIIAPPSPLLQALRHWFTLRHRDFRVVEPAELETLGTVALMDAIVLEMTSTLALQGSTYQELPRVELKQLLKRCQHARAPYIFLSDGRVFDGNEPLSHQEAEEPHPASAAGGKLYALEKMVAQEVNTHFILRTGPIFSESGENLLTSLFGDITRGGRIAYTNMLKTCPTHCSDLVRVISGVIDQISCDAQCWGTYHYNSSGPATAFEFAEVVYAHVSQRINLAGAAPELAVDELGRGIDPAVPVLRCERILQHFGIKQLPWRSYLPKAVKILCEGDSQ